MNIPHITAKELKTKLQRGDQFILLDVRQESERKKAHIPNSKFITLSALPECCDQLDSSLEIVVYCHLGGRSAQATNFLIQKGYKAVNLEGGITAWTQSGESAPPGN